MCKQTCKLVNCFVNMKTLILLGTLCLCTNAAREFRFDYEFSEEADGWLKYHIIPSTWEEARLRCHAEGAVLASPLHHRLKSAILSFVNKHNDSIPSIIFTGVHASFSKGDYSSIEGVPLLRLAITWVPGEPDNFNNSESCLAMLVNSNGTVFDTKCNNVFPYVCFKRNTDIHINECGTSDPEYYLEHKTGSCYKFHSRGLVWSEAYMTCVAEGGYLAIINDDKEAKVITEIFSKHPDNTIFSPYRGSLLVGFHDWGHYGDNFMTIHGETLESHYHVWGDKQPDNGTRLRSGDLGQYCGSVFRNGVLDDVYCNAPVAFLCEMDPRSLLRRGDILKNHK